MRDFPPPVSAYTGDAPQRPDARSPRHLLWWLVRQQGDLLAAASVFSVLWMLPTALTPWVFGRAVDQGIDTGDAGQVVGWLAVLLMITVLGASSGIFYHTVVVRSWLVALYGTTSHVTHQSVALGHVLPRRSPTGEVLSVSGSDGDQFGGFMEILSRAIGNLVAYAVVALIVLSVSLKLGLVVLLVAPLLVLTSAPLLRPMGRAQTQERSRDSELTSLATDIVAGLRILRGIGGERIFGDNYASQSQRVRVAGVRAGLWQAIVEAVGVLFSGLFVVALMWLGVQELAQGRLTIGELIAFLGYALFLVQPIRVFFEFAQKVTRARVSARKAITVLGQPYPWPSARPTEGTSPAPAQGSAPASTPAQGPAPASTPAGAAAPALSGNAELYDVASGLRVAPGVLTMVVSAVPDESAALADRLGRYLPGGPEPTPLDPGEELTGRAARDARRAAEQQRRDLIGRDAQRASSAWRVSLGGVDLADADIARVRETILVSDTGAHVFAGTLQQAVDPHGRLTRQQAERALHTAAAQDVYDILPGGWQGVLDERGRGLSGGQRQRLVLTRALAADPPILVLVEPTSAVDAHTEARIAQRLPAARAGRTTVVMTASPLLLHHADDIALLVDGQVRATGTHDELMASSTAYRRVVIRGDDRRVDDLAPAAGAPHEEVTRP